MTIEPFARLVFVQEVKDTGAFGALCLSGDFHAVTSSDTSER